MLYQQYLIYFKKYITLLKKSLFTLCAIIMCTFAHAQQIEKLIPYPDTTVNMDNQTHIVDSDGNTYLASNVDVYYPGPGLPFDGTLLLGDCVTKLNIDGDTVWQHLYPTAYTDDNTDNTFAFPPITQMFLWNGNLAMPYNIYVGERPCPDSVNNGFGGQSTRNGILILSKDGLVITNKIFAPDQYCSRNDLIYTAHKNDGIPFTYVYDNMFDPTQPVLLDKRNDTFASVALLSADSLFYRKVGSPYSFIFDTYANRYVSYDNLNMYISDTTGKTTNIISLSALAAGDPLQPRGIILNKDYYVLNYDRYQNGLYNHYLAVLSKDGSIVSASPSFYFSTLSITDDDQLWGVVGVDTSEKPFQLMQMDIFQNVKRQLRIGFKHVFVKAISINRGIVRVSGFFATDGPGDNKAPDRVYYYQEQVKDIPLLGDTTQYYGRINTYPNPVTTTLHITSDNANATYGTTLSLYNMLGQMVGRYNWTESNMTIDMSNFAKGIYLLKNESRGGNIYTQKIVKL